MHFGTFRDAAASGGFWAAWLLLAAAALLPNPTAAFLLSFLAATCAVIALALGGTRQRIGAAVALLLAIWLAFSTAAKAGNDPYFKKHRATPSRQTN